MATGTRPTPSIRIQSPLCLLGEKCRWAKKNDDLGKSLLKRHPGEPRIGPGVRQNDGFWGNPPPKEMLEVLDKGGITPLLKEMFGKS